MELPPRDLTAEESRVLGCLIEKEATTPDTYPLTLNALRNACNQSTSRDPVMAMTDAEVNAALTSLRERGLTRTVHSTSNRATKYRHVAPEVLELSSEETAVLSVLLLRGAQTAGEIKSRTERRHRFATTDEVTATFTGLAARTEALVVELERRPGQKDARWIELLSAQVASPDQPGKDSAGGGGDPYGEATAEFYDLLATAHWETFGLQLLDLLSDVDPAAGPIVDVGAGTGVGLSYLLAAVPGARIHAIEPSRAMRTALHTRLATDEPLRRATTVDPNTWRDADLPDRASALVISAALGHLNQADRASLWQYIATRVAPGAPAVVEVLPPERPIDVPEHRYRELQVGRFTYEGWQRGEPAGDHHMQWTMEYRVVEGERRIATYNVQSRWWCCSVDDLRDEIAAHGLTLATYDECVVIRR